MRVSIYSLNQGGKYQTVAAMSKTDAKSASDINKMGMLRVEFFQKATLVGNYESFKITGDDGHVYGYISIGNDLIAAID